MSVMKPDGMKVVLPRQGAEEFWEIVREHYAGENSLRWKTLAILALRENAGWPLETIGQVFGHHRGHVSRILVQVKRELQQTFACSPDWLCLDDPDTEPCEQKQPAPLRDQQGFSNPQRS